MAYPAKTPGSLDQIGFPELIRSLHEGRWSGRLSVHSAGVEKSVTFQDGRLIFARSTNPDDRLGEFLLRRGVISVRQYVESAQQIGPGRRQGAILCEMGAISPDDLFSFVKEQVSAIISSLFQWTSGEYQLLEEAGVAESIVLSIPMEDVILQGVRGITDWPRIWSGVGGELGARFSPTARGSQLDYHATLTSDEVHLLSLVNSRLDLSRILDLSYAPNFETCRMLWALLLVGAIEPDRGTGASMPPIEDYALAELVESYDRVFTYVHGFVSERLGDVVDHFMDRVVVEAARSEALGLSGVHMRNQGRIEYEQLVANLHSLPQGERRERVVGVLGALFEGLMVLTARELGDEECSTLRRELDDFVGEWPEGLGGSGETDATA